MISVAIDASEFAAAGRALITELQEEEGHFLKRQARMLLDDLVHMTPPSDKRSGNITSQSFNVQRKAGEAAVARDIAKVFRPVSDIGKYLAEHSHDPKMKTRIENYAAAGNRQAIKTILRDLIGRQIDVRNEVEPALHMVRRNKRGRVGAKGPITFILNERQLRAYIKEVQKHVGASKSGWNKAASALGLHLPAWITRHHMPGVYTDETQHKTPVLSLTIGNLTGWANDFANLDMINTALRIRSNAMKADLAGVLARAAGTFNRHKHR